MNKELLNEQIKKLKEENVVLKINSNTNYNETIYNVLKNNELYANIILKNSNNYLYLEEKTDEDLKLRLCLILEIIKNENNVIEILEELTAKKIVLDNLTTEEYNKIVELYNSFNKNDTEEFTYVSCKFKNSKNNKLYTYKTKNNVKIGEEIEIENKWGHYSTLIIEDFVKEPNFECEEI